MIGINVISAVLGYEDLDSIMRNLKGDRQQKVCYVTFSKTSSFLTQRFKGAGIPVKGIFFIDLITTSLSSLASHPESNSIVFLDTDTDLFALYEKIEEVMKKHECSKLIFDSLSSLVVYQQQKDIFSFIKRLTAMLKNNRRDGVFLVLSQDMDSDFIRSLVPMMDNA